MNVSQALKETLERLQEKKKAYLLRAIRQRRRGQNHSSDASFLRALEYDKLIRQLQP